MKLRQLSAVLVLGVATLGLTSTRGRAASPAEAAPSLSVADQLCEAPPEVGTIFEGGLVPDPGPPQPVKADTKTVAPESPCPEGMVHVKGDYCTEVRHECLEWLDDESLPFARCQKYSREAQCVGRRVSMSFCMDRFEYTKRGEDLPANYMSFALGQKLCQAEGKRLCTDSEWNFACEGEQMRPYPYGWEREPKCNQDRDDLFEKKLVDGKLRQVLRDHREPSSDDSECVSPFGVVNMAGNLDEPVLREATRFSPPFRNALKGGWWMAARNRCRPATTAHDDYYRDIQVGVRCCADVPGEAAPTG